MTLSVGRFDGDHAEWDAFVRGTAGWTHCHLFGWKRVMESALRHECLYLAAREADGRLAGVLPLVSVLTNEQSSEEFTAVAAFHLESMGTNAVGALQALLTNDEPAVRRLARNALLKIDPEALNRR